ncbi:MAG: dTDP-4-dehydrorhamnose 3,5-epimerase family protein [Syntrophales bacterium]|nr:dTDP-4-dehydrorhamnose 3,5-epimerase family protein [Syntrophales bacterium]
MQVERTTLPNVLLFTHECFEDHRGTYEELYNKIKFDEICNQYLGHTIEFLETNIAVSSRHVLRGLHGDNRTWKYVTCLKGKYFINVLCYDEESICYGQYESFVLSEQNKKQLLIPPKYGHGYVVMSEEAIFYYQQSCVYRGMKEQFTIRYNDSRFNMWWPIQTPILSKRDEIGHPIE